MSDHWNKLADVLGTPSLDPIQKKSPSDAATTSSQSAPSKAVAQNVVHHEEPPKAAKPAKKSSWDSITEFFGISSRSRDTVEETTTEPDPLPIKGFGEEPAPQVVARERSPQPSRRREPPQRPAAHTDKRPKPAKSSMWSAPEPEATVAPEEHEPVAEIPSFSNVEAIDDVTSDVSFENPERRGRRRRSRRGRGGERNPRLDAAEPVENNDPIDLDFSEPAELPARVEPQARTDSRSRSEPRGRSDSRGRSNSRGRSDGPNRSRPPVHETPAPRAFAAGFDDDPPLVDAPLDEATDDAWPAVDPAADESPAARPRRRRRRRGSSSTSGAPRPDGDIRPAIDSTRDEDADFADPEDVDEGGVRRPHIKVPTWGEAMSILVEANMLNHQRTPAHSRRRGPPPRRRD
jgi:hypothetical protein